VPVWHKATKKWRESGQLTVVGITQEQHPDRCRLFAQWHGIDWPILWDPLNMTGSRVVPRFFLIDEHGIVRSKRANPESLEEMFLDKEFEKPASFPEHPKGTGKELIEVLTTPKSDPQYATYRALSDLLWPPKPGDWSTIDVLSKLPEDTKSAFGRAMIFRRGVAHCMRRDSPQHEPRDFELALRSWETALAADDRQYIWRRRIQQYGPRMDKPYPFYDWVAKAQKEIRARGETPIPLPVALTGAELALRAGSLQPGADSSEPDGEHKIESIAGLVRMETAVAFDTNTRRPNLARVHLTLRPAKKTVKWDPEAGTPVVWIAARRVKPKSTPRADGSGIAFELDATFEAGKPLRGYVLFYACLDDSGQCRYLRHDFAVAGR